MIGVLTGTLKIGLLMAQVNRIFVTLCDLTIDVLFLGTDKDEAQRRREEKRLQRQKEIEAKRNLRQGGSQGGPLKLGAKKMGQ